jgi:hypothetical protein
MVCETRRVCTLKMSLQFSKKHEKRFKFKNLPYCFDSRTVILPTVFVKKNIVNDKSCFVRGFPVFLSFFRPARDGVSRLISLT